MCCVTGEEKPSPPVALVDPFCEQAELTRNALELLSFCVIHLVCVCSVKGACLSCASRPSDPSGDGEVALLGASGSGFPAMDSAELASVRVS